jgi:hypothetical protein
MHGGGIQTPFGARNAIAMLLTYLAPVIPGAFFMSVN